MAADGITAFIRSSLRRTKRPYPILNFLSDAKITVFRRPDIVLFCLVSGTISKDDLRSFRGVNAFGSAMLFAICRCSEVVSRKKRIRHNPGWLRYADVFHE